MLSSGDVKVDSGLGLGLEKREDQEISWLSK